MYDFRSAKQFGSLALLTRSCYYNNLWFSGFYHTKTKTDPDFRALHPDNRVTVTHQTIICSRLLMPAQINGSQFSIWKQQILGNIQRYCEVYMILWPFRYIKVLRCQIVKERNDKIFIQSKWESFNTAWLWPTDRDSLGCLDLSSSTQLVNTGGLHPPLSPPPSVSTLWHKAEVTTSACLLCVFSVCSSTWIWRSFTHCDLLYQEECQ